MASRYWIGRGYDFVGHLLVKSEKSIVFSLVKRRSKNNDWVKRAF